MQNKKELKYLLININCFQLSTFLLVNVLLKLEKLHRISKNVLIKNYIDFNNNLSIMIMEAKAFNNTIGAIERNKRISKIRNINDSCKKYGLDINYEVDRIILKCMKIQKLLDKSSRVIKKFAKDVKSLNIETNQMFRPAGLPLIRSTVNVDEVSHAINHRQIFDRILQYSDVSDEEEPNECNTSLRNYKDKRSKRHRFNKIMSCKTPMNEVRAACAAQETLNGAIKLH